jgi:predicted transcriptional regulator
MTKNPIAETAVKLRAEGWKIVAIAAHLKRSKGAVDKYIRNAKPAPYLKLKEAKANGRS